MAGVPAEPEFVEQLPAFARQLALPGEVALDVDPAAEGDVLRVAGDPLVPVGRDELAQLPVALEPDGVGVVEIRAELVVGGEVVLAELPLEAEGVEFLGQLGGELAVAVEGSAGIDPGTEKTVFAPAQRHTGVAEAPLEIAYKQFDDLCAQY